MVIPRKTVIEQLLSYCDWAEQATRYYGQKQQFDNRHKEAKAWLQSILDKYDS